MLRPTLVDTHVHLDDQQFDADRAEVIASARAAGVERLVHIGYRPEIWTSALRIASHVPGVACTLGVHPGHVEEAVDADLDRLAALASRPEVVAVGEIGLDRYWTSDTLESQLAWFQRQIDVALSLGKPIVIHQRSAADEVRSVLTASDPSLRVLLHSFDGDTGLADLARRRHYVLGVGGLMTRRSSGALRDVIRSFPLDRIVLETDAPYLVPAGVKSKRNSPANLPLVAASLAELRGIEVQEVADRTTETALRFFGLDGTASAVAEG